MTMEQVDFINLYIFLVRFLINVHASESLSSSLKFKIPNNFICSLIICKTIMQKMKCINKKTLHQLIQNQFIEFGLNIKRRKMEFTVIFLSAAIGKIASTVKNKNQFTRFP